MVTMFLCVKDILFYQYGKLYERYILYLATIRQQ